MGPRQSAKRLTIEARFCYGSRAKSLICVPSVRLALFFLTCGRAHSEGPICQTVRSAFRRGCLEVDRKTACDFVHQRRDGHRHAADFLIVEHHLLG